MNLAQIRLVLGNVLARLTALAHTDQLTGVANRRGLLRSIERTDERATRGDSGYVVPMVDVDHFKASTTGTATSEATACSSVWR